MSLIGQLRLFHSCYFSKPSAYRPIYRAIRRSHPRKIVELGIGDGRRALRMIAVAKLTLAGRDIQYVGLDRFEDQAESAGLRLTLKEAHRLFGGAGVRARLVPGDPPESLVRVANSLGKVDMLILPAGMDAPAMARTWFFVPRMLHQDSIVFIERAEPDGRLRLDVLPPQTIDGLAAAGSLRRAA